MDDDSRTVSFGDIGNHAIPRAIFITEGTFALFAVAIRLFARCLRRKFGISDILIIISLVGHIVSFFDKTSASRWIWTNANIHYLQGFFLGHYWNAYQVVIYPGLGVHQWQLDPKLAAASHYSFKLGSILFGLDIVFLKAAILLDWERTFAPLGTSKTLFWIIHTLIWTNVVFYFVGTFIEAFQCPPEKAIGCPIDAGKYNITSGIINVISDLTILIAPHWVVWRLKMTKARKMGVSLLFLMGIFATVSAVIRVYYVTISFSTGDILFHSLGINLWAIAEQTFGYLVIGVPSLPPIFREIRAARVFSFPRVCPNRRGQNRRNNGGNNNDEVVDGGHFTRRERYEDPWQVGDLDTCVLVTMAPHDREPGVGPDPVPGKDERGRRYFCDKAHETMLESSQV
ncbi:hypothetical protein GGS20DRAFT_73430 [Poronia punctata]|nr:hypothetical protein GGS20DRAFT_73430 [Poronia punctata]